MIPTDSEFAQLTELFKSLFGLALGQEKRYLVSMRLESVLKKHQLKSYPELLVRCQNSVYADIRADVIDAMTTRETSFFRDTHPFQAIETSILPELVQRWSTNGMISRDKIRIWSAACSTGQEVYSLAILIEEHCRRAQTAGSVKTSVNDFSIIATDISNQAIQDARSGQYSLFEVQRGLSEFRRQQYFTPHGQFFRVRDELKRIAEFRHGNILQRSTMPNNIDLIMCRNVLLYFDEATRVQVIEDMTQCLRIGGYLMLGAAEITSRFPNSLEQISIGPTVVYRKRSG